MPTYRLQGAKETAYGLNEEASADDLMPGELQRAENVHYRDQCIAAKRPGVQHFLGGGEDDVVKGGPVAESLSLMGHPWWFEHEDLRPLSQTTNFGRGMFHARHGAAVIPEGSTTGLRLNVRNDVRESALELTLWSDDFPIFPVDTSRLDLGFRKAVVINKGWRAPWGSTNGSRYNWQVVLKTDATEQNDDPVYYIALEVFENAVATPITSFEFRFGGNPSSLFRPGARHWVAWHIDTTNEDVRSYFWRSDAPLLLSSVQSYSGTSLATNGSVPTDSGGCPIRVGLTEVGSMAGVSGFNGVVGELRVYNSTTDGSIALPTWNSGYPYFQTEIRDADLANFVSDYDLTLYLSMSKERLSADGRFVVPRHSIAPAGEHDAWLTGADASWVTPQAGSRLGKTALAFCPWSDVSGQGAAFHRALFSYIPLNRTDGGTGTVQNIGGEISVAGLRMPNAKAYLVRNQNNGTADLDYPPQFTIRMKFRTGDLDDGWLDSTTEPTKQVLWGLFRVRRGTAPNEHSYNVQRGYSLEIVNNAGGTYFLRWLASTTGTDTMSCQSAALTPNTEYVVHATIAWGADGGTQHHAARLYIDGVLVASDNSSTTNSGTAHERPLPSQTTNADANGENKSDDDGRDESYIATIGCDARTTDISATGSLHRTMFGAPAQLLSNANGAKPARRYWAFHNNITKKFADDGCVSRAGGVFRGWIGGLDIWGKVLTADEIQAQSSDDLTNEQVAAYGPTMRSSYLFDEGKGGVLFDRGQLKNHIPFHPFPEVRTATEGIERQSKTPIEAIFDFRTTSPREGAPDRLYLGIAGGSVIELLDDGTLEGQSYAKQLSSRLMHQREFIPTAFQFRDFQYFCTGLGPVIRVTSRQVSAAGISSPVGYTRQDNLGFAEADRDGTFQVLPEEAANAGETVFEEGKRYTWAVTFYDGAAAVESVPSRFMTVFVESSGGFGWKNATLALLPKPVDRHVTNYRIYRGVANSSRNLRRVDEVSVYPFYTDAKTDNAISSLPVLGTQEYDPPPRNIHIGVSMGQRALYVSTDDPATLRFSVAGFPEYVPFSYRIDVLRKKSDAITGIHVRRDVAYVFMRDECFIARDGGGDIGFGSLEPVAPVQMIRLKESEGSLCHHGIVYIDGVGSVFPGERGLYVLDINNAFNYIGNRIKKTWSTLDQTTAQSWHAVHWRSEDEYLLFCPQGSTTTVICWDYRRNSFSVLKWKMRLIFSQVIERRADGANRLVVFDDQGQAYEYRISATNDGAARGSFATTKGTLKQVGTTTRLRLVNDNTLPIAADGLRGTPIVVQGNESTIVWNDANFVEVDPAVPNALPIGANWKLGSIEAHAEFGRMDMGDHTRLKKFNWSELEMDDQYTESVVEVEGKIDTGRGRAYVRPASRRHLRCGPWIGRGRSLQVSIRDPDGGLPDNPWRVTDILHSFHPRGRAAWSR